jgi:hypothetical protein
MKTTKAEKMLKKLKKDHADFVESTDAMDTDSLTNLVLQYEQGIKDADDFLETNDRIKELKEELSEITGPSNDAKKVCRLKIQYLVSLLEEKGVVVSTKSA